MGERYRFTEKNGALHLMKEATFLDDDCGKLNETFTGNLTTSNFISMNYTLEDISPMFSSGTKYRVTKSNGEQGIMTKISFSDYYEYEDI